MKTDAIQSLYFFRPRIKIFDTESTSIITRGFPRKSLWLFFILNKRFWSEGCIAFFSILVTFL